MAKGKTKAPKTESKKEDPKKEEQTEQIEEPKPSEELKDQVDSKPENEENVVAIPESTTTVANKEATVPDSTAPIEYESLNEYHKLIYPWQQHTSPAHSKYYYFNPFTRESLWELPSELKARVTAFFERVRDTESDRREVNMEKYLDVDAKKEEAQKVLELDYMKRPARKQVETPITQRFAYRQGDEIYNIWYDKFLSDDKFKEREQAPSKINVEDDIGYTKADIYEKNQTYFCIHFARGCCVEAQNCRYFHHIPTLEECMAIDQIKDIFGRTRYSKQRDDMEGVGSFASETRTLKLTDFCLIKGADEVALTYECLWRHFGLLGEVEDIHLVAERCVAFVRYKHRCMAEFAKEAMANQPLESNEIMIVRWAESDLFGQDPQDVLNRPVEAPEVDDRFGKGGKLRKQRKKRDDKTDETAAELKRLNEQEELLAKRLDAEKEYSIVTQRMDQIQGRVSMMENVLKKIKPDETKVNPNKALDLDAFMQSYKKQTVNQGPIPGPSAPMNPALNDAPLF